MMFFGHIKKFRILVLAGILLSNCQDNSKTIKKVQGDASPLTPPNILLITSEDHGPHLSSYGDTIINTPNLDKIANDGILF
ncbi:MAG: hypothetical protein WD431_06015, partial [Cyclobacteriaceae bacterium]